MKNLSILTPLREALARDGRATVRVALESGPCWVTALRLDERRGDARVHLDLGGARLVLSAERVLEVMS